MLKTAGGYLIVLQTFDKEGNGLEQCVRLMQVAKDEGDWDLCTELARFLMAVDGSGNELRNAIKKMGIKLKQSSPSQTPISPQQDAVDEDHVAGENARFKAARPDPNGAPTGYGAERLDNDDELSPKSVVRGEVGQDNQNRFEEDGGGQEDYFTHRGGL